MTDFQIKEMERFENEVGRQAFGKGSDGEYLYLTDFEKDGIKIFLLYLIQRVREDERKKMKLEYVCTEPGEMIKLIDQYKADERERVTKMAEGMIINTKHMQHTVSNDPLEECAYCDALAKNAALTSLIASLREKPVREGEK